ncbi:MAG: hypothetical protein ACHQ01_10290 [Candidatus Limnocylindrales bacterium]
MIARGRLSCDTAVRRVIGIHRYGPALAQITAAGAVLRLAFIARQAIGLDENFTAVVVHQPIARVLDIVAHDSAPPLFYLLERGVVAGADKLGLASFGGPGGPVALRLIPAIAGIVSIPLIAALGRRVAGDRAGLWAGLFAAFAPTTVMLSDFARMYSLAAAATLAAALLLWRAAAVAVWSDYFSVFALAGICAAALVFRPPRRIAAVGVASTAVAVATLAPWLIVASAQFQHTGQGFWVAPLSPSLIGGTLSQLFMGPPIDARLPFSSELVFLQEVAVVAGSAALLAAAGSWHRLDAEDRGAAAFCFVAAGGVALLAVVSIWRPILDGRYAGVMWLPLFALVGVGLAAIPRRAATVLVTAVAVPALALSVVPTHAETSFLVPELDASVGQNDAVLSAWSNYLVLLDEAGPTVQSRLHVLSSTGLPWFVGTAAYPPGAIVHSVPADVIAGGGRIFWIADPGIGLPSAPPGYRVLESRCVNLACLTIYAPPGG